MKRPGFNNDRLKRRHRKALLFNDNEINAINNYCKKYKVKNKSKFMREVILTEVLTQFEKDHPKLFNY